MRRIVVLLAAGTLLMLLHTTALAQGTVVVETKDNFFSPAEITVKAGDSIEFRNTGLAPHTAEDKAGSFNSGNLNSGQSTTVRFDREGTFELICVYHETVGMTGRIVVSAAAATPTPSPSPSPSPTEAAALTQDEFDPDAGVPIGMKAFPFLAGGMLFLLILAVGLGYIRNVQKTTETQ